MVRLATIILLVFLLQGVAYASPDAERLAPDGDTFTLTNLSGAFTDVDDDPDSPDGNWLTTASNNNDTGCLASFPTPSGNPTQGADVQEFRVLVRQYDEGQSGTPEARVDLYEGGVELATGTLTEIPDGGIVISFTWDASLLANADGSGVECYVYGKKTGGSPGARNSVEVGAIEWNVDYTMEEPPPTPPPPTAPSEILPEGLPPAVGIGHLAWFIPLIIFSILAFWMCNGLLFMLAGGSSLMMGFSWYDIFTTNLGLSIGILLVAYGLVCLIFALGCLFKRRRVSE